MARRIGLGLRDARRRAGARQVDVANRAGISQSFYSRVERGLALTASLETLASCAEAVGHQLAAFLELAPGATPPRDLEHLRRQQLVVEVARPGGWKGTPESALPGDGLHPRSIDVRLDRPESGEIAIVEIEDFLADVGATMRNLDAKVNVIAAGTPGSSVAGLLLVRRTRRNQQLVAEIRGLIAARYPGSSSDWLRALSDPDVPMPAAGGFAWTSVGGDRLIAARLGRSPGSSRTTRRAPSPKASPTAAPHGDRERLDQAPGNATAR